MLPSVLGNIGGKSVAPHLAEQLGGRFADPAFIIAY
jgi:hypothetical protein